jgi:hypothetical protein
MQHLTSRGRDFINDVARRYGVSCDSAVCVLRLGGVSQQQGGSISLTFSSQYGTLSTFSLPLVSGPGFQPGNASNFAAPPAPVYQPQHQHPSGDLVALRGRLGQLRDTGILAPEEFIAKKSYLLNCL